MKLIDKSALVAEIERRIKNLYPKEGQGMVVTKILKDHYEDLLDFLNTLEVKEMKEEPVSEKLLDKAAKLHVIETRGEDVVWDENAGCAMLDFKAGAKWQKSR